MSSSIRSSRGFFDRNFSMGDASDISDYLDIANMVSQLKPDDLEDHLSGAASSQATRQRSAAKAIPKPTVSSVYTSGAVNSQPSSAGSSGSGFISGIMNPGGTGLLSHTPPTQFGTSYEAQHFGKRPRAGSISGRLRSASELEDKGIIDRQQKAILKDLIISGDEDLQAALDQYEQGNTAQLETMIRSGELSNRAAADIDLLGDLDLDFLTVDDHFGGMAAEEATMPPIHSTGSSARSAPIPLHPPPSLPTRDQASHGTQVVHPNMVSPSAYADDGIGELEFNGDFFLPASAGTHSYGSTTKESVTTSLETADQRFRSNSLAFGALLNDQTVSTENQVLYGRWMDTDFLTQQQSQGREGMPPSGIGASLALYGRSKSDSGMMTKAQLAEEKRRVKQEKREQKEREKSEKKERRESQMREKKEKDARDKRDRKEKKSPKSKLFVEEEEEPMERPSGLGIPRSMSDPNLTSRIDGNGLLSVERPEGWVGAYSPESRKVRIDRFLAKRGHRVWTKKVKYDVRKNFADSRLRVKGRFVKKEDELLMRDLMSLT